MQRLTKRLPDNYYDCSNLTDEKLNEIYSLAQVYEDTKEEFDFDLDEAMYLYKAVKSQGFVYIKENWGISTLQLTNADLDIEIVHNRLYSNTCGLYYDLPIKDYGVWWALTKEELQEADEK